MNETQTLNDYGISEYVPSSAKEAQSVVRRGGPGGSQVSNQNRSRQSNFSAMFSCDDLVALKIRGIPYQATFDDVSGLFREFDIV